MTNPNKRQAPFAPDLKNPTDVMKRVWRGKLQKLCRLRFDTHYLPDNHDGRAMLAALLCFGLTDESALADAHWCAAELPMLKARARRLKWCDVGKLIGLTYDEREACKLWIANPVDVPPEEVKRRRCDKRKAADKARKKRQRDQLRDEREGMRAASKRCDAVLRMLELRNRAFPRKPGACNVPRTVAGWMPVSALVELAANSRAFRRPDGRPLRNLRDAVHCTVKKLVSHSVIETRLESGPRGSVLLVKAAIGKADTFSDGRSVGSDLPAKAQETRAFERQTAPSAGNVDTSSPEQVDDTATPSGAAAEDDDGGVLSFPAISRTAERNRTASDQNIEFADTAISATAIVDADTISCWRDDYAHLAIIEDVRLARYAKAGFLIYGQSDFTITPLGYAVSGQESASKKVAAA